MFLTRMRTQTKNRIHGILTRYNLRFEVSDLFGATGRQQLSARLCELPEHTRQSVEQLLVHLDFVAMQVEDCEKRLELILGNSAERDLLQSMPCVGKILGAVIALEIGDVRRFAGADRLASYAGTVPRVKGTGGRNRLVGCSQEVNQNLKWALVEAANLVVLNPHKLVGSHVLRLYQRVKRRTKKHGKATTAVARHLAEAAYWILSKQQEYREPKSSPVSSSTNG
jgi:transposase